MLKRDSVFKSPKIEPREDGESSPSANAGAASIIRIPKAIDIVFILFPKVLISQFLFVNLFLNIITLKNKKYQHRLVIQAT